MLINRHTVLLAAALGLATSGAYAATFDEIDSDLSGDLSLEEFKSAFLGEGETLFDMYNTDAGDGTAEVVTKDEITDYNTANYSSDETDPALTLSDEAFDVADVNEDGVISKGEMLDHFGPEAQVALAKFDKNGDGIVTLDEVRSSDDPKGERGRGSLERPTKTSSTRDNSENRSEASSARDNSENRSEASSARDNSENRSEASGTRGNSGSRSEGNGQGGGKGRD
jgi:Ca2+-binding EF-hand superfamily protein